MSLNFDLSRIKNKDELCWEDVADDYTPGMMDSVVEKEGGGLQRMKSATSSLIWVTMALGMGAITKKNIDEFAARLHIWEGIIGGLRYKVGNNPNESKHIKFKYEELVDHIGLSTNVGKDSWTVFMKKIRRKAEEETRYARQNYKKRLEERDSESVDSNAPAAVVG